MQYINNYNKNFYDDLKKDGNFRQQKYKKFIDNLNCNNYLTKDYNSNYLDKINYNFRQNRWSIKNINLNRKESNSKLLNYSKDLKNYTNMFKLNTSSEFIIKD